MQGARNLVPEEESSLDQPSGVAFEAPWLMYAAPPRLLSALTPGPDAQPAWVLGTGLAWGVLLGDTAAVGQ